MAPHIADICCAGSRGKDDVRREQEDSASHPPGKQAGTGEIGSPKGDDIQKKQQFHLLCKKRYGRKSLQDNLKEQCVGVEKGHRGQTEHDLTDPDPLGNAAALRSFCVPVSSVFVHPVSSFITLILHSFRHRFPVKRFSDSLQSFFPYPSSFLCLWQWRQHL